MDNALQIVIYNVRLATSLQLASNLIESIGVQNQHGGSAVVSAYTHQGHSQGWGLVTVTLGHAAS